MPAVAMTAVEMGAVQAGPIVRWTSAVGCIQSRSKKPRHQRGFWFAVVGSAFELGGFSLAFPEFSVDDHHGSWVVRCELDASE